MKDKIKAIIIPGNGGTSPENNWYPYVERELTKLNIEAVNKAFPDPMLARAEFWLPFIEQLGADEQTILIGHSSGAIAALRFAENHPIFGSVLVSAHETDLGIASEKISGYFEKPWDWNTIRNNQKWIVQFASSDDPLIPISEARSLQKHINSEYYEYTDQKHFGYSKEPKLEFPELINILKEKIYG